jgi:hypothetical protein
MIEFLNFTFQSFWHFLGVFILLLLICETISNVVTNICKTIIACTTGVIIDGKDKDDKEEE